MRTKYCHLCDREEQTLYRVRYQTDKKWQFLCKGCVEKEKLINPLYQYGGTWKK